MIIIITFRVSRRRRLMYIGHARLSVCLSVAAFPHYCTDPDVTWISDKAYNSHSSFGSSRSTVVAIGEDEITPNSCSVLECFCILLIVSFTQRNSTVQHLSISVWQLRMMRRPPSQRSHIYNKNKPRHLLRHFFRFTSVPVIFCTVRLSLYEWQCASGLLADIYWILKSYMEYAKRGRS